MGGAGVGVEGIRDGRGSMIGLISVSHWKYFLGRIPLGREKWVRILGVRGGKGVIEKEEPYEKKGLSWRKGKRRKHPERELKKVRENKSITQMGKEKKVEGGSVVAE